MNTVCFVVENKPADSYQFDAFKFLMIWGDLFQKILLANTEL